VGIDLLDEQRAQAKLPPISDEEGHVPHVHAAAQRGLGTETRLHRITRRPRSNTAETPRNY
jgi:hypothetical protein